LLSATVRGTIDDQYPFLCNNISLGLMGASPSATQGIGRYVVRDVTDLNWFGQRLNTVLHGICLTSFKNWMPTSGWLNRNKINNLFEVLNALNDKSLVGSMFSDLEKAFD